MIVRIRTPQGLIRIDVQDDTRWNQVLRTHNSGDLVRGRSLVLRRHGDVDKINLLSSVENGKTLGEQGVRHGDLFYLEPSTATRLCVPDDAVIVSPATTGSKIAFSGWSHAEIYSRIRSFWMGEPKA